MMGHPDSSWLRGTAMFRLFRERRVLNIVEGYVVDGVNGVDLFLPRQDLGRMNTDLEDTVDNETYVCLCTRVRLGCIRF